MSDVPVLDSLEDKSPVGPRLDNTELDTTCELNKLLDGEDPLEAIDE